MIRNDIYKVVQKIKEKQKTEDPFQIADALGIQIEEVYNLKNTKGFFKNILGIGFIFINANLPDADKQVVCAHELGHAVLHKELCKQKKILLDNTSLLVDSIAEKEADLFAANLLIDDRDLEQTIPIGESSEKISRLLGVDEKLLEIKQQDYAIRKSENK